MGIAKTSARGVQATVGGTVLVGVLQTAKTHAAMAVSDAVMNVVMAAVVAVTMDALAHRRRIQWINQRLRTRETW